MEAAMPPVPPQVAAQQGPPPIRQFAQGAAGGAQPDSGQGQDPNAMMSGLVNEIGQKMTQLAQIMGSTKPELVPILKQAVQALVMVSGKLQTGGPGGQPGQGGAPPGGSQGTAGEGAPDAGGGAAMAMPQ